LRKITTLQNRAELRSSRVRICPKGERFPLDAQLINSVDVIAIQRFSLGLSTGIANGGKDQFNPVNRW
jgi:hypothetical protein